MIAIEIPDATDPDADRVVREFLNYVLDVSVEKQLGLSKREADGGTDRV